MVVGWSSGKYHRMAVGGMTSLWTTSLKLTVKILRMMLLCLKSSLPPAIPAV